VVASFVDEDGLPVTLPSDVDDVPQDVVAINITVEPAGTFIVNGRVLSASSVQPYVQALYAENPEAGFRVLLAEGSKVKDAVIAIEAGRSIGIEVVPVAREE